MKFYLTDTFEEKEITIKSWNGSSYGPDCFYDLETNFPEDHEIVEDGEAYICTSEEYEELKKWWGEEVETMNNGTCAHDMDYSEQHKERPELYTTIFAD